MEDLVHHQFARTIAKLVKVEPHAHLLDVMKAFML